MTQLYMTTVNSCHSTLAVASAVSNYRLAGASACRITAKAVIPISRDLIGSAGICAAHMKTM